MNALHRNTPDVKEHDTMNACCKMVRGLALILLITTLVGPAHAALRGSITLRHNASTNDRSIKLKDVADLEGKGAFDLGDVKIAQFEADQTKVTISMTGVRKILRQRELNWSRLTLGGHTQCRVMREGASVTHHDMRFTSKPKGKKTVKNQPKEGRTARMDVHQSIKKSPTGLPKEDSFSRTNPHHRVSLNRPTTLKELIIQRIAQLANKQPGKLDISFHQRDQKRLEQNLSGKRFEVEPHSSDGIGRIPIRVRQYEGVDITGRFTVMTNVRILALATVSTTRINRGERITAGDLEVREIALDNSQAQPITDNDSIIGLVAATTLHEGEPIESEDVQSPILVQRGERITVRCLSGDLVVRTVGRARNDGARGEMIKIRNLVSGDTYEAIVTGRSEAAVPSNNNERKVAPITSNVGSNRTDES